MLSRVILALTLRKNKGLFYFLRWVDRWGQHNIFFLGLIMIDHVVFIYVCIHSMSYKASRKHIPVHDLLKNLLSISITHHACCLSSCLASCLHEQAWNKQCGALALTFIHLFVIVKLTGVHVTWQNLIPISVNPQQLCYTLTWCLCGTRHSSNPPLNSRIIAYKDNFK